jgi:1-deoxy-D-xylulose-5-phosphate reductoisomerase
MGEIKKICILGSTGSIGRNSLEVIQNFPQTYRAAFLTANSNIDLLQEQISQFSPDGVAILDNESARLLGKRLNGVTRQYVGEEGILDLVRNGDFDILISSLVGFAGLRPTIEAIKRGKRIALANKETLVVAGEIVTALARKHGATIIPVDSEHSAILQCLAGEDPAHVSRLILTASGGPFLHTGRNEFSRITVEDALKHPNWKMGSKITIDSATMMNKGLEVIEAHWLFGLPAEKIEVLIHPQSIIHSMVEFVDGSIKAQLGVPDMKIPIQYALTHPARSASVYERVNFAGLKQITFLKPDMEKFESLALAYRALSLGGTVPAIMNAANEIAVAAFLKRRITFDRIPALIRDAMEHVPSMQAPELEDIIAADTMTRQYITQQL